MSSAGFEPAIREFRLKAYTSDRTATRVGQNDIDQFHQKPVICFGAENSDMHTDRPTGLLSSNMLWNARTTVRVIFKIILFKHCK
jgi:hypothetical protein